MPENNIMAESENGEADVGLLHRRFLLAELCEDKRQRLEERLLEDPQRISRIASFVLPRASLGGAGAELPIQAGIDRVELFLELAENAGEGHYRAVLEEKHATELLSWDELTATRFDWGPAVRIDLPAERLAPGAYALRLFTDDAPGSPVEIGRYSFTVVRSE